MDLNDAGADSRDDSKPVLGIDLNEIPSSSSSHETLASSPRDAFDVVRTFHGSVTPAPGAPADKPLTSASHKCAVCDLPELLDAFTVCDGCERGFHNTCAGMMELPVQRIDEWVCGDCVSSGVGSQLWRLGASSSSSSTLKRKHDGSRLLDINLSPPSDGEGEGSEDMLHLLRRHSAGNDTSGEPSVSETVAYPNVLYSGSGFGFQRAPGITQTIRFGFKDISQPHHTQALVRYFQELDLGFPLGKLRCSTNSAGKLPHRNANDIFLQALRKFISERHGLLEEGWHVELKQSISGCEVYAVYCSPDGRTFLSMSEVASHLGLRSNFNSVEPEVKVEGSAALHKQLHLAKRRKSAKLSVANGLSGNKEVLIGGLHGEVLSGVRNMDLFASPFGDNVEVREDKVETKCPTDSRPLDEGFPIQFEDFFVLSLGKIDARPPYHDASHLWPVGYKSCWHDKITGSVFLCEVLDGGDTGPIFRVSRRSCSSWPVPNGSTILFVNPCCSDAQSRRYCNDSVSLYMGCDEDSSIEMLLSDPCPPLENDVLNCLETPSNENHVFLPFSSEQTKSSSGNALCDDLENRDMIGEFLLEGRTLSSVWKMMSQKLTDACCEIYKPTGTFRLYCKHLKSETCYSGMAGMEERDRLSSLTKFCSSAGPVNIPSVIDDVDGSETLCCMLAKWLDQNRSGLDMEFIQEIIEQIPGIEACSRYECLTKRNSSSITVGNGFLSFKTKDGVLGNEEAFDGLFNRGKRTWIPLVEDSWPNSQCPPLGKPLGIKLPQEHVGDVLQVWELLSRFNEVLELKDSPEYEILEEELFCPWFDGSSLTEKLSQDMQDISEKNSHGTDGICAPNIISSSEGGGEELRENKELFINMETREMKEAAQARLASVTYSRCNGVALAKTHDALLKVLVGELQSRVAALVDPNFDAGDTKPRRGRKKDVDSSVPIRRAKLNLLPINELTWPEIARRYILAVLAMDGSLDSAEIASRESAKVFRCLQGDGGVLCGSLTGVAGMEADALLLAEAKKRVLGHLNRENNFVTFEEIETDAADTCERKATAEGSMPEWAQPLEPVRKLPTNVGTRIRNCVHAALRLDPPEWARKILEHSISKEVYKGNASGPTKKAVISVLADVHGERLQKKPDKTKKRKSVVAVSDIVMKQCRIVLRRAAAADESKVFCNLLGKKLMNSCDNDDEGLLGSPAMVSRPLDFRTIDLKLALGAYGGSHEAFHEDVREFWSNVRCAFGDQSNYIELAEALSQNFESLYETEVTSLAQKLIEFAKSECSSPEVRKEVEDLVASTSKIPKAPWDEGVCKVCGVDKDDDSVLLCDTCDAEYHTYCLNPPLVRIPDGNWYCPSCVARTKVHSSSEHVQLVTQRKRKKYQGDLTRAYLEELTNLASMMEEKEYWEFSVNERIFLLKFMCDELLTSALVRQHVEQCMEMSAELQQKLRLMSVEWKNLKFREDLLAARAVKLDSALPDALAEAKNDEGLGSSLATSSKSSVKNLEFSVDLPQQNGSQVGFGNSDLAKSPPITYPYSSFGYHDSSSTGTGGLLQRGNAITEDRSIVFSDIASHDGDAPQKKQVVPRSSSVTQEANNGLGDEFSLQSCVAKDVERGVQMLVLAESQEMSIPLDSSNLLPGTKGPNLVECVSDAVTELKAYNIELKAIKNDISVLQDSISNIESQLLKLSVRREYLGTDSSGRLYWVLIKPGRHPWIIVDGSVQYHERQELKNKRTHSATKTSSLFCTIRHPNVGSSTITTSGCETTGASFSCTAWVAYQSDVEVKELVEWLKDDDPKERQLKEAIMQCQKLRYRECQTSVCQDRVEHAESTNNDGSTSSSSLIVNAAKVLTKKYGPFLEYEIVEIVKKRGKKAKVAHEEKLYRCECLEPIWPSRPHCPYCHLTFFSNLELEGHSDGKCNLGLLVSEKSKENIDQLKGKANKPENLLEECKGQTDIAEMSRQECSNLSSRLIRFENEGLVCPFKFEDISSKFITRDSNQELVKEIGLIGTGGVPTFVPGISPYLSEFTAMLITPKEDTLSGVNESAPGAQSIFSGETRNTVNVSNDNKSNTSLRETFDADRSALGCSNQNDGKFCLKGNGLDTGISHCCVVPQSSLRPLVGKVSQILRRLKINLLDMDAAIPEEALRTSKTHLEWRWAWRAFTKSAETIFEMVQATIVLEDMIKSDFLKKDWWYWSSLSAAVKTSTLSSLALRIYALDAAIMYECDVSSTSDRDQCMLDSKPYHLQLPDLDTVEKSRLNRRPSKRRKEMEG